MRNKKYGNRKAFGLIEITLALAITAVVGFVVFRTYSNAKIEKDAKEIVSEVQMIFAAVQNIYGSRSHYRDLETDQILPYLPKYMSFEENGIQPGGMTGAIRMSGNAHGSLFPLSSNIPYRTGWMIQLTHISNQVCSKIATNYYGRHVTAVVINGAASFETAPTPTEAASFCNDENNGLFGNTIILQMLV